MSDSRDAYSTPIRHYHNLRHIEQCLEEFRAVEPECFDPASVEAAIWFHDAVYDARRPDNEERSAVMAREVLAGAGADSEWVDQVEELILATKHVAPPATPDAELLVDIDLSILGKPPPQFDAYERAIREEYRHVDEQPFRAGRAIILRRFLDRPYIYFTSVSRGRYEQAARVNLRRSLERFEPGT